MAKLQRKRTIGLTGYHLTAPEWKQVMKVLDDAIKEEVRVGKKKLLANLTDIPKDTKKLKIIGVTVWY